MPLRIGADDMTTDYPQMIGEMRSSGVQEMLVPRPSLQPPHQDQRRLLAGPPPADIEDRFVCRAASAARISDRIFRKAQWALVDGMFGGPSLTILPGLMPIWQADETIRVDRGLAEFRERLVHCSAIARRGISANPRTSVLPRRSHGTCNSSSGTSAIWSRNRSMTKHFSPSSIPASAEAPVRPR